MIFGICATLTIDVLTLTRGDFNSESSSWELEGWDGQCSLDFIKNSGPFHHNLFSTSWVAVVPQDAMSAGFCLVGTYFHNSGGASLLISNNRFSTICLNSLLEFRIQLSTTVESDQ
jgi:hypothetical protein